MVGLLVMAGVLALAFVGAAIEVVFENNDLLRKLTATSRG